MGLDFRKSLIVELERRQREIDTVLAVLHRLKKGEVWRYVETGWIAESKPKKPASEAKRGPALYAEVLELRSQGLSLRAIAEHVHLSHAGVWKVLRGGRR
jgi:DNA-binding NarL/FixJ family response regulator